MLKVENHKVSERRAARVTTVPELLKAMEGHGNKTLFSYFKGKDVLTLTYREFLHRVRSLAAGFIKMVLNEGRTAVVGETSPEWLETYLATLLAGLFLLFYLRRFSNELGRRASGEVDHQSRSSSKQVLSKAIGIAWPLWIQNLAVRGAYIAATVIIAPLGTIAIAANSFAIIAEGFCYLPGYGMQDAATTLVGQSLGAGRKDLARRFAGITILSGSSMMFVLAVLMWIFAPQLMGMLTPDAEVVSLGARCLRIEAWAEFFFGVGIVANGCCVGAGDTLFPSILNLLSMWVIRIGAALLLIPRFGLEGYWYAMAAELTVKGIVFAARIRGTRWMRKNLAT